MIYDDFPKKRGRRFSRLWVRRPSEGRGLPLVVDKAGYALWERGDYYARGKDHREFTLELVTEGEASVCLGERLFTVPRGCLYILPPGIPHRYECESRRLFKRFLVLSSTDGGLLSPLWPLAGTCRPAEPGRIKGLFKAITSEMEGRCDGIELSGLAYRLLLELQRDRREDYPSPVIRSIGYIQRHLDRNLPVGELAGAAGVSVSHLNRLFVEHLGSSPMRYFRNQRMNWAADLIENTGLSIKEIAFRTGFENPGYFSHRFKDHFGISPIALRRK